MADAVLFFRRHFGKSTAVFIFKERIISERAAAALLKRDTAGAFAADDLCGLERGSDRDAADKAGSALISRYIGDVQLRDLGIAEVNGWMAQMTEEGYSPKTVSNPFRLLKQALKWAVAQDMLTKNPCDFCKPPQRSKTKINALNREDRTRMLGLARQAPGQPLSMAKV